MSDVCTPTLSLHSPYFCALHLRGQNACPGTDT
ncbi:hypothetical protein PS685_00431 [Pseudomonas fluorescens]|uniref:Uncharacterized protein n=1 Tax=Pseudomonas fluorescens TaxID=294 RepID=A0A5E6YDG3_PSEFL|nr:hypothetical protein PS685_00431 [Pseudomonas fluorescens]